MFSGISKSIISLFAAFLLCPMVFAEILNVPDDYVTIQDAIDEAENSDTLLVSPGEYYTTVEDHGISFRGKDIVVGSLFITTGDTNYIDSTVVTRPGNL